MPDRDRPANPLEELAAVGRDLYDRGWGVGVTGSLSVLLARKPTRLCITSADRRASSFDEENFLEIDDDAEILQGFGKPADETLLHLAIYRRRPRARCILFSRSVAGTVLSDKHFVDGGIAIRGYEAQCGLPGVASHEETVTVPIIENSRDYVALSHVLENVLIEQPHLKGFLIRRHGFFTWGETVEDTMAQLQIFEFLFEVILRSGK